MKPSAIVLSAGLLVAGLMLPGVSRAQGPGPEAPDPGGAPMAAPAPDPGGAPGMPGRAFHRPGPGGMSGGMFGAWWKNSETAIAIGLSDDQVKQIESTFMSHKLKLIDLRADLEKRELELKPLVDADQPDVAKVSAQIDQVVAARGRLEKEATMMSLDIRRVLTVEQWKKLKEYQQQRMRDFGRAWRGMRDGRDGHDGHGGKDGMRGPQHRPGQTPPPPPPPGSSDDEED
jgi:Spy/CpxP family protein refolding chaperone